MNIDTNEMLRSFQKNGEWELVKIDAQQHDEEDINSITLNVSATILLK